MFLYISGAYFYLTLLQNIVVQYLQVLFWYIVLPHPNPLSKQQWC